jgi:MarR family 2-MHQ and catechol resistance regulon transcriptional repressor
MNHQIDDELVGKFFNVSKLMHQMTTVSSTVCQFSLREMMVLKLVQKHHSVTIQQVATFLKNTMATTSVLLDKLEKNNFIQRVSNPDDKRSTLIILSPKADKIINKLIKAKSKKMKLCLSYLSSTDKQTMIQVLDRLILKLQTQHEKK